MKSDIVHMLQKSAITGAATALAGVALTGSNNYYQFPGLKTAVPLPLITGLLGVANSFVTDGVHKVIHEYIPLGKKTSDITAFSVNAAISGASFFALLHLAGTEIPYTFNPLNAVLAGALGEVGGAATYEYLSNNLYI